MSDSIRIESATQAAAIIRAELPKVQMEERVFVLPLDANGKVLAKPILVSVGHQNGTATIDAGAIFREALKAGAEEIIVAHNHPSGDPSPSKADIAATAKLREAGDLLGVPILDHIILGASNSGNGIDFVSLAEGMPCVFSFPFSTSQSHGRTKNCMLNIALQNQSRSSSNP